MLKETLEAKVKIIKNIDNGGIDCLVNDIKSHPCIKSVSNDRNNIFVTVKNTAKADDVVNPIMHDWITKNLDDNTIDCNILYNVLHISDSKYLIII